MAGGTFDHLTSIGARLLKRAADMEYICELALDRPSEGSDSSAEPTLNELIGLLRVHRGRVAERAETRFALAVGAVNWAYSRAPGEGFRESFSRALLRSHEAYSDRLWEEELGRVIEGALIVHGSLAGPGFGPYRYVGAIREQAGVTEVEIPVFADLLATLESRGVDCSSGSGDDAAILDAVERVLGAHARLARFLRSPAGLRFVKETASVVAWVRGDEPWLATAVGYPPGFLVRLLEELARARSTGPSRRPSAEAESGSGRERATAQPELCFDARSGTLVLRFPEEPGTSFFLQTPTEMAVAGAGLTVGTDIPSHEVYAGTVRRDGVEADWYCVGWPPDAHPLTLFGDDGRMVAVGDLLARKRGRLLACLFAGEAVGMLSKGFRSPRTVELTGRRGLSLGAGTDRHGWCVVDTGLSEVRRALAAMASVEWEQPSRPTDEPLGTDSAPALEAMPGADWTRYAGRVVGFDGWARFTVRGWDASSERRFAVTVRLDDGRTAELVPTRGENGRPAVMFTPDGPLCSGVIRVTPKGRLRTNRSLQAPMRFAIATGLHVSAPGRLLGTDESAVVELVPPSGCRVQPLSSDTRVFDGRVEAIGDRTSVAVRLAAGPHGVDLEIPVFRAGLDYGEQRRDLVLDLEQLAGDEDDGPILVARGWPDSTVGIGIDERGAGCVEVDRVEIGEDGTCEVDGMRLVEQLANAGILGGRIMLLASGKQVATRTWFLDVQRATSANPGNAGPTNLPATVAEALRAIRNIREGVPAWEPTPNVLWPRSLAQRSASWFDVRHALEQTEERDFTSEHSELCRVVRGARRCVLDRSGIEVATKFLAAFETAAPAAVLRADGFLLPRWGEGLGRTEAELRRLADASGLLRAWTHGCRTGESVSPTPPASLLNVGRALVTADACTGPAWRMALSVLQSPDLNLGRPWDEVGGSLLMLCLLRRGHVRACLDQWKVLSIRWLPPVREHLAALARLLSSETWQPAAGATGLDLISPRRDDSLLGAALSGGPSEWRLAAGCSWMHAWLGWRAAVLGGPGAADRAEMLAAARDHIPALPSSLDAVRVRAELSADCPEDWHAR